MATLGVPGVDSVFAFAGEGGLNNNGGGGGPADAIAAAAGELTPGPTARALALEMGLDPATLTGTAILQRLAQRYAEIPAIRDRDLEPGAGPASAKPVHLRLTGVGLCRLREATRLVRAQFDQTPGLTGIDDTLPLRASTGRSMSMSTRPAGSAADVATVGARWCNWLPAASSLTRCGCPLGRRGGNPRPPAGRGSGAVGRSLR